jgi:hypothetical protein
MEANEAMPNGYDPAEYDSAELRAEKILLGLRIRAVARRALKMGTLALVATAVLTGVTVGNGGTAQAATAIEAPQPDPAPVSARFGLGTWLDIENGVVWVSAPVRTTAPASALPRVQVQELTRVAWSSVVACVSVPTTWHVDWCTWGWALTACAWSCLAWLPAAGAP